MFFLSQFQRPSELHCHSKLFLHLKPCFHQSFPINSQSKQPFWDATGTLAEALTSAGRPWAEQTAHHTYVPQESELITFSLTPVNFRSSLFYWAALGLGPSKWTPSLVRGEWERNREARPSGQSMARLLSVLNEAAWVLGKYERVRVERYEGDSCRNTEQLFIVLPSTYPLPQFFSFYFLIYNNYEMGGQILLLIIISSFTTLFGFLFYTEYWIHLDKYRNM